MLSRRRGKSANPTPNGEQLTKEFVRLYYGILHSHPEQLFQFYDDDSTVIVSEFRAGVEPTKETAESREDIRRLLKSVFDNVTPKIKTALPQFTVDGGVLLLVSGTLTRAASTSKDGGEHCFTQALVLAPQEGGYYILNDTIHIMGSLADIETAAAQNDHEEGSGAVEGKFYPMFHTQSSIAATAVRPKGTLTSLSGHYRSTSSDVGTHNEIKSDSDSDQSSVKASPALRSKSRPIQHHQIMHPGVMKPFSAVPPPSTGPNSNGKPVRVNVGVPPPMSSTSSARTPGSRNENRPMHVPPGCGVFIARLPFGIQAEEVEKVFAEFGPVLNGADGIQVRDGRNGCYAFVTFETPAAAQIAIDKGAVVQGKRVYVESRYPRQDPADPSYNSLPSPGAQSQLTASATTEWQDRPASLGPRLPNKEE